MIRSQAVTFDGGRQLVVVADRALGEGALEHKSAHQKRIRGLLWVFDAEVRRSALWALLDSSTHLAPTRHSQPTGMKHEENVWG